MVWGKSYYRIGAGAMTTRIWLTRSMSAALPLGVRRSPDVDAGFAGWWGERGGVSPTVVGLDPLPPAG